MFDKTQPRTCTKESKNEDRPYSTPRSSPNAEGLQTNHHNIVLSNYDLTKQQLYSGNFSQIVLLQYSLETINSEEADSPF